MFKRRLMKSGILQIINLEEGAVRSHAEEIASIVEEFSDEQLEVYARRLKQLSDIVSKEIKGREK